MKEWGRLLIVSVALIGIAAACATPAPTPDWATCVPNGPGACTTLDGIALGPYGGPVSLATQPCDACLDEPRTARAALERMAPNHPAVTAIDRFGPDLHVLCGNARCDGGGWGIFVFTFADRTTLPIVVACFVPIGSVCQQVDRYGPS